MNNSGDIRWSHAVNSKEKLLRFLGDLETDFIESDIRLSLQQGIPVAAHPPETESDLTFEKLITSLETSRKGLKLDFKDPEILLPCLERLRGSKLQQIVFLNADVLQGNGASPSKFDADEFIELSRKIYPQGILSLGWTTVADSEKSYTKENIDEMLKLCEKYELNEATFPVRACLLPKSQEELQRLTSLENYTLTIWNNEPVSQELASWIKKHTDPRKTFYDFIDDNKEPLRLW